MADTHPSRPEPTANGTLAKTPLVNLLVYVSERKMSGMLEFVAPDRRSAVVTFVEGSPSKVRTSDAVAHLGRVLFELGHLTEMQLTRSLADLAKEKASGKRLHGELLASQGIVDEAKIESGLREQVTRKLRHIATMPAETAYGYYEGFDGLRTWGREGKGFDPLPMLWGILRESPPADQVSAANAKVANSALRLKDASRLGLTGPELAAVTLLRAKPLRPAELAKAGALDEATGQLLTYLLLITKQVEVLPASAASPAPSPQPPARTTPQPPARATPPPPQDRMSPVPTPSREPPGRSSGMPAARVSALPPPVTLSPELSERWREIVGRAATIDKTDYFGMLELARDASTEEVESAFFALAKVWHPDRLPAALSPIRDPCARVFARMSEARSTLADADARAKYMKLLAEGSGSPEAQDAVAKVVEAVTLFQKAEICFRRNAFAQAEERCRKAIELDDSQADYHAMLAWLLSLKPEGQTPEGTLKSIRMLDKAVGKSERCEKAYYWRGMLQKRLGNTEAAARDFRHVAELNPRNIDAAREVRLATMRGGGAHAAGSKKSDSTPPPAATQDGKAGLFGRLFKKS